MTLQQAKDKSLALMTIDNDYLGFEIYEIGSSILFDCKPIGYCATKRTRRLNDPNFEATNKRDIKKQIKNFWNKK